MKIAAPVIVVCWLAISPSYAADLQKLIRDSCLECHDESTAEGELDLTSLGQLDEEQEASVYERMVARIENGEMPPPDYSSLNPSTKREFVGLLQQRLESLADELKDDPGDVPMIRLTPYEYRNIMRDISGGVFTTGGLYLPNEGGAGEGFSNVGAAQSIGLIQYEKYVEAAIETLKHVRFYPFAETGGNVASEVWSAFPMSNVDETMRARQEVVDEILSWHIAQQQRWGEEHRKELQSRLGFVHPAYMEAAWRYQTRDDAKLPLEAFACIAIDPEATNGDCIPLATAALRKWYAILRSTDSESVHHAWAKAWQDLPKDAGIPIGEIRKQCVQIVAGQADVIIETEDYAPDYEISFHEAKEEVLQAAETEGHWPFRIEIGDAAELFLIVTDAGDGGRGEYAVWQRGRFVYRDGSTQPWEEVVEVIGANSGKTYPFGFDGENQHNLAQDAVGAKPPGALKFEVPSGAIVFEVDLSLDRARTEKASIQALVLKEKPKSQSYISGRYVFGGKKRPMNAGAKLRKDQERALRKRNIAEANKTKIGLNAERNVFAEWNRTTVEEIGGPWKDHVLDQYEAAFPYHYTVAEVIQNAEAPAMSDLRELQNRLEALVRSPADERRVLAVNSIKRFAELLWRRRLEQESVQHLVDLYDESQREGLSFDASLKAAILGLLISPEFLFRGGEQTRAMHESKQRVVLRSSTDVASRLSFFLWASIPDEEIRDLASQNRLNRLPELRFQARRMLSDSRAKSLAIDFASQLWGFTDFSSFDSPDPERFAAFTPQLRTAMRTEVELVLADIFQNDRPLTDILDGEYTFANELLVEHYELEVGEQLGGEFRRIRLPSGRFGLATAGMFLTKTSLPLRTSPVQRGVWLMENMLGRPLPNPPADVPVLSEDDKNAEGESILVQLQKHRANIACASCHDKIDPLGISLEGFDGIGRVRESTRSDPSQDAVTTHDGFELRGAEGLKSYLRLHQDEFVAHFNRKLLGYALGRSVTIGDRALLEQMKLALERNEYRFSSLVETIVSSPQFRYRRNPSL